MLLTKLFNSRVIIASSVILGSILVYKATRIILYRMNQTTAAEKATPNPSREGGSKMEMTKKKNFLDNFKIHKVIGYGAYSKVFKAEDLKTKKIIALKQYRMDGKSGLYERAATEMSFVRMVNHENIIKFVLCDITIENMYLGVEYSKYGCLSEFMQHGNPAPEIFVQFIMKQLISALAYLHGMHIMHGDVKPANIIVTSIRPSFSIKLTDFGLSSVLVRETHSTKVGTFFYMAPEIHLGRPYDSTVDFYSAGIVMYQLIYGDKPFQETIAEDAFMHLLQMSTPIEYPRGITEKLSTNCMDLLRGLLNYDPRERHFNNGIIRHPFLNIGQISYNRNHYKEGYEWLCKSIDLAEKRLYGPAYVDISQAISHMRIYCKSVIHNAELYTYLRGRLAEYTGLRDKIHELLLTDNKSMVEPLFRPLHNEKLRCMLTCIPSLLPAFDLCLVGEWLLAKSHTEAGMKKLREGLDMLSVALPKEPDSDYKKCLLRKYTKWTNVLERVQAAEKRRVSQCVV